MRLLYLRGIIPQDMRRCSAFGVLLIFLFGLFPVRIDVAYFIRSIKRLPFLRAIIIFANVNYLKGVKKATPVYHCASVYFLKLFRIACQPAFCISKEFAFSASKLSVISV